MELIVDLAAQHFSGWLALQDICKLETALCSAEDIYEALVLEKYTMDDASVVLKTVGLISCSKSSIGQLRN